jgi:hypothetical protein
VVKMIGGDGGEGCAGVESLGIDLMARFGGPARMGSPTSDCASTVEPQKDAEPHGGWIGWIPRVNRPR